MTNQSKIFTIIIKRLFIHDTTKKFKKYSLFNIPYIILILWLILT